MKAYLLFLAAVPFLGCSTESIDWSGKWHGTASLVVDGERKEIPLGLELNQDGTGIRGAIHWGEHRREIVSASASGPEVELESVTTDDRIRLKGLFRNDAIQGRFWVHYASDPEPYPGSFNVVKQE